MAYIVPVAGTISQGFGANPAYYAQFGQKGHNGIDYAAPTGTPVRASADGTVHFEGWGQYQAWMGKVAGICIILDHGSVYTGYAHLTSTIINRGQTVKAGQIIGYVGATGTATGSHLHFEFLLKPVNTANGYYGRVNPSSYLTTGARTLVNKEDLDAIYLYGALGRPRNGNEGEDVYLGKPASFVINDHAASTEGKTRLTALKVHKDYYAAKPQHEATLAAKDAEIVKLKQQLANSGGVDAETKALVKDTNTVVKSIRDKLFSIFK